ncbi:MAG: methyltransferase family protein [Nitrospinales bacterium]
MQLFLIIFSASVFLGFSWAHFFYFKKPANDFCFPARLISAFFTTNYACNLYFIYRGNISTWEFALSFLIYSLSVWLYFWALSVAKGKELFLIYTGKPPRDIVKEGPYRYIGHPIYFSYILFVLAGVFGSGNYYLTVTFLITAAIFFKAAKSEESFLASSELGSKYLKYRGQRRVFFRASN